MSEKRITNKLIEKYWSMINDRWRNQFFYTALNKHAKDKVVLDIGSGTGILSFYALAAGAKFVYAIEQDKHSANITYQVLKRNFDTSRFVVLNVLFPQNLDPSTIKQPIDILVSETVGPGLFDQGMINTWNMVKPYLSSDAISIPDTLSCDLWVWQNQFDSDYLDDLLPDVLSRKKLSSDACIDQNFFNTLMELNKDINDEDMRWVNINLLKTDPSIIFKDKVSYTMNSLPVLNQTLGPNSQQPKADIAFEFNIDAPASVAIINKISFESETLLIKDAPLMPWRYNPMFNLNYPGKYKMIYNNNIFSTFPAYESFPPFYEQEWLCTRSSTG